MAVSDWWMLVSFYQNVLAIPLAIVALVLVVRAKTRRRRVLYAALIPLLLLPNIQVFAGNLYFDYLCRTQAGEFIYRTVDNVEGILQMRPRDGSKDYFDRMRAGDLPEDPWGHTNVEAQHPEWLFVNASTKYDYLEINLPKSPRTVDRYSEYDHRLKKQMRVEKSVTSKSKFGFDWSETTPFASRLLHIYGGRIVVVDLGANSILAEKTGFLRVRPYRICPRDKTEEVAYNFVSKVARPKAVSSLEVRK